MNDNETQDDTITVNVETGARSDDKPTFEIIDHDDGQKYISVEQVGDYKAHQTAEYKAVQDELDSVLAEIDAIDQVNAIEARQKELDEFVAKNGDDYDLSEFIDFSNENEFKDFMSYLTKMTQSSYKDPSALLGYSRKEPKADGHKELYKQGQENARRVLEGRR